MGDDLTTLWYRFNQPSYPMLGGYLKYFGIKEPRAPSFEKKWKIVDFGSLKTLKDMSGFMKELAIFLAII
jgi:hypothetical protein